ncbi:hypothetical protein CHS0354_012454 [Potamilus streckersoni]|uniref:FERM domain-containing protein n=1 Tax=Potamilus streckersoni TaxID=2493646 RepID=A0AAE0VJ97_9BIVA|nr:hypothetical protein CHS0354_012454 [Potamilus streckersoni]
MSKLSRFFPKLFRGEKEKQTNHAEKMIDKNVCRVLFLDATDQILPFKGSLKAQILMDKVFDHLNLFERDYFGLRYIDQTGQTHWLDGQKSISAQLKNCSLPYTLYFGVKFYAADPCKIREELTRYQLFLQIKQDILQGRLPISFDDAAELFSYAVQSELGDFDPSRLPDGYVSEFHFMPNQTEELEDRIAFYHRRLGGQVPAVAEYRFLDKVKWLDMYGVDLHPVLGEGNTEYFLGLTPTGIVVYKNKTKVGNYFWPRIMKVTYKGKVFMIKVKDKINDEHTYAFDLVTKAACKHLWKCCLEHQAFFRLNQLGEPTPKQGKLFSLGSKHRYSGRQNRETTSDLMNRPQPNVMRIPSRRNARRTLSDSRLDNGMPFSTVDGRGVTVINPEQTVRGPRHRSLPDLKGKDSPTSARSAPWEADADVGLYTSGRDSPTSVTQSENLKHRRKRDSDSESASGYRRKHHQSMYSQHYLYGSRSRSQHLGYESDPYSGSHYRRKYFPRSNKGSDNESDASVNRRRREVDSGSESDVSNHLKSKSNIRADNLDLEWKEQLQSLYLAGKEKRANGSIPSVHSAPVGEAKQKRMRRKRSKSPGNSKRPPEELRQHIEFELVDPEGLTEDQMKEIPFIKVETKAEPFKIKYSPKMRHRYRSPKRKTFGDVEQQLHIVDRSSEPTYTSIPKEPEVMPRELPVRPSGYQSDSTSFVTSVSRRTMQNSEPANRSSYQSNHPRHSPSRSQVSDSNNNYRNSVRPSGKPPDRSPDRPLGYHDQSQFSHSRTTQQSSFNINPNTSHTDSMDSPSVNHPAENDSGYTDNFNNSNRARDPSFSSSHSSTSRVQPTPSAASHLFGTQDQIARLYGNHNGGTRGMFGGSSNPSSAYKTNTDDQANSYISGTQIPPNKDNLQTRDYNSVRTLSTEQRTERQAESNRTGNHLSPFMGNKLENSSSPFTGNRPVDQSSPYMGHRPVNQSSTYAGNRLGNQSFSHSKQYQKPQSSPSKPFETQPVVSNGPANQSYGYIQSNQNSSGRTQFSPNKSGTSQPYQYNNQSLPPQPDNLKPVYGGRPPTSNTAVQNLSFNPAFQNSNSQSYMHQDETVNDSSDSELETEPILV